MEEGVKGIHDIWRSRWLYGNWVIARLILEIEMEGFSRILHWNWYT
jgi:hypothetical protein